MKFWFSDIPSHSKKLLYFPLVTCSMEKRIFIGNLHSKIRCSLSHRRYLINSWQMTRMNNFGQLLNDWWTIMAWSRWFGAAFIWVIELSRVVCTELNSVDMAGGWQWKWWAVGSAVQKSKVTEQMRVLTDYYTWIAILTCCRHYNLNHNPIEGGSRSTQMCYFLKEIKIGLMVPICVLYDYPSTRIAVIIYYTNVSFTYGKKLHGIR